MKSPMMLLLLSALSLGTAYAAPAPGTTTPAGTIVTSSGPQTEKEQREAALRILTAQPQESAVPAPEATKQAEPTEKDVPAPRAEVSASAPLLAVADTGGASVQGGAAAEALAIPSIETDVGQEAFASLFLRKVLDGDWAMVAVLMLIVAVALIRTFGGKLIPKLQPYLEKGSVTWTLAVFLGAATVVGNAMLVGVPLTGSLVLKGIIIGLTGTGLARGGQLAMRAKAAAQAAGVEAASAVSTREDAVAAHTASGGAK